MTRCPWGEVTIDAWLGDMAEALGVGQRIGERVVVVVGTSLGGTLTVWAALEPALADELAALEEVEVPLLVAYVPDDGVVDASETERAFARFGSELKVLFPVEHVEDPGRHVPAGDILSPETTESVRDAVLAFLVDVLEIEIARVPCAGAPGLTPNLTQ